MVQYAVKLDQLWDQAEGDKVLRYATPSLGTVVAPDAVLTHNHFLPVPQGAWAEALQVTPPGQASVVAPIAAVGVERLNAQTNRFTLAGAGLAAPYPPLASAETLAGLSAGDALSVVYWDAAAGQLAQGEFAITAVEPGVLTLADPGRVINGGDSGGGAFYQGELVGNTLCILLDPERQPVGLFNVALLTPDK